MVFFSSFIFSCLNQLAAVKIQTDDMQEGGLDAQELLVELSKLRVQAQVRYIAKSRSMFSSLNGVSCTAFRKETAMGHMPLSSSTPFWQSG
jgi:hypothetical protein